MKKWISVLLMICLMLTLASCDKNTSVSTDNAQTSTGENTAGTDGADPSGTDETSPTEPVPTEPEPALTENFTFEIGGVTYNLPTSYQTFVDNGWSLKLVKKGLTEESEVAGYSREYINLVNGKAQLRVCAINMSGNTKLIKDCNIGAVTVMADDGLDFKMDEGITLSTTIEQLQDTYGPATYVEPFDNYTIVRYVLPPYSEVVFYIYTTQTEYNTVTLQNLTPAPSDYTIPQNRRPGFFDNYVAPQKLSTDPTATQFLLDGVVYQLPCPLEQFINNGWVVAKDPIVSVGAGNSKYGMILQKGDACLPVGLFNFDKIELTSNNCAVYEIDFTSANLDGQDPGFVRFPGDLGMDSDFATAEKTCKKFQKTEGLSYTSLIKQDKLSTWMVRYSFNEEGDVIITMRSRNWTYPEPK